jgi:hypothetical protein
MKNLAKILFIVVCSGLAFSCSKSNEMAEEIPEGKLKSAKQHDVTVPFKVTFYSIEGEEGNGTPCEGLEGNDAWVSAHQIGEGTGTQLGKFSLDVTFCFYNAPDEFFGKYINTLFVFTAANGDELYGTIDEGQVVLFPEPDENGNIAVYNDLMKIKGGTGKFEGATGEGYVDSYLPLPGNQWQHSIDSYITLVKGKR